MPIQLTPLLPNLPPDGLWYRSDLAWALERESIFKRNWACVAIEDEISEVNSYLPTSLFGSPIILTRPGDAILGFSNVCLHRGAQIAQEPGLAKFISCPYHGWTYGLDGALRSTPAAHGDDETVICPQPGSGLKAVAIEVLGPLIFANFLSFPTDSSAFAAFCAVLKKRLSNEQTLKPILHREYYVRANWKLVIENFLECYHCSVVHRSSLATTVNLDEYKIVPRSGYIEYEVVPTKAAENLRGGQAASRHIYYLFPGTAITVSDTGFVTFQAIPLSPDLTLVRRDLGGSFSSIESVKYFDTVMMEDIHVLESLQQQTGAVGYTPGPYVLPAESGVQQFHMDYRAALIEQGM